MNGAEDKAAAAKRGMGLAPEPPTGWPIGSYATYARAQEAVDHLSDEKFPVADVTIVGVDLMQVERVVGRLSWSTVIGRGVLMGMWWGIFLGLVVGLVTGQLGMPLLFGVTFGIAFGVTSEAIGYAATRGRRDFTSTTRIVAGRYDVLCLPATAERGRDLLARLEMKSR